MDEQIKPLLNVVETEYGNGLSYVGAFGELPLGGYYPQQSIDALRAEVQWAMAAVESKAGWEWRKRAERAEAEAEALMADAERYRWQRQDAGFDGWTMPKPPAPCPDSIAGCKVQHHGREVSGAALDAAIDAARKGAEEVRYTITPKGREMLNGG